MLRWYNETTAKRVILLVDATFAPNSKVLGQMRALYPELNTIVFLSMSKSVSRGLTTAGCFIFNHTEEAARLRHEVVAAAELMDTSAKGEQLAILCANHRGVEERNAKAYAVAREVGEHLVDTVKRVTGKEMKLAFVTPETAALGFTTPTFSFNLPAIEDAAPGVNEGLAQRFVDEISVYSDFVKPCVSFGQDNGKLYATVPATSTQGAIKEEDKAKQAAGGVQLTRLSFPPTINVERIKAAFAEAVETIYAGKKK